MTATNVDASVLGDSRRLRVLAGIDFDDRGLRAGLDEVTARTAVRTGMPVAVAGLMLGTANLIVGQSGLDGWIVEAGGVPAEWSFCATTVTLGTPYVVPDTRRSAEAANPLVVIDGVGCYAGVPVTLHGEVVGAHCVLGAEPHDFTAADLAHLFTGAAEITHLLLEHSDLY